MALKLLCLPCAGASATMYLRWRRLLPRWIEIVPVELPGRGSRLGEHFVEDFGTLADRLCDEQAAVMRGSSGGPQAFALFGHSMGALLAHGMAQRLRERGERLPRALIVSGSAAPSRRDTSRLQQALGDDQALAADLRRQGGTPDEVFDNAELLRLTLDVLGADYRVCDSYRHVRGRRCPCRCTSSPGARTRSRRTGSPPGRSSPRRPRRWTGSMAAISSCGSRRARC